MEDPLYVIIIEDHPDVADALAEGLQENHSPEFEVDVAASLHEGLSAVADRSPDVVMLDLNLPDTKGLATVDAFRIGRSDLPVVVLTSTDDDYMAVEALRRGADDYLVKGQADVRLIVRSIRYAIERKAAERHRDELIKELRQALANVRTLHGLLPMCAWCKKIRDDEGYWQRVEYYITHHTDATFTHGLCPECAERIGEEIRSPHG